MVGQATYYGYDKDGNNLVHGTADNANNYINPDDVAKAIENLANVIIEQMSTIARELAKVGEDSRSAIVVQGTSMGGTIDELNEIIVALPDQLLNGIDALYQNAVIARNSCQEQLNRQMYNQVASYSGVVRVG